jgi:hypothetical protein
LQTEPNANASAHAGPFGWSSGGPVMAIRGIEGGSGLMEPGIGEAGRGVRDRRGDADVATGRTAEVRVMLALLAEE